MCLFPSPKMRVPPTPPPITGPPPVPEVIPEKELVKETKSAKKRRLAKGRRGLRIDLAGPSVGASSSGLNIPS